MVLTTLGRGGSSILVVERTGAGACAGDKAPAGTVDRRSPALTGRIVYGMSASGFTHGLSEIHYFNHVRILSY